MPAQNGIAETRAEEKETAASAGPENDGEPSADSFEGLLRDDPDDRRTYDAYAQTLIGERNFGKASEVYRRALQREATLQNNGGIPLQDVIRETRELEKFSEAMGKEPSWEQARKIPFAGGELVTNIPREYSESLARDLAVLMEEEIALMKEILGPPEGEVPFLRISVAGRPEEYKALWREKGLPLEALSSGAYRIGQDEIVVFFTGTHVRWALAHELAHCFLRKLYMEEPSRFLDEGLGNYLTFKLAKEGARPLVEEMLGRLKDFHSEAKSQRALDLFSSWEKYEQFPGSEGKNDFYLRAWSLTAFFLDGKSPFFSKFFRDYIQYELEMGPLSRKDTENYFRANLPEPKVRDLDREWGLFIEKMNYDNI